MAEMGLFCRVSGASVYDDWWQEVQHFPMQIVRLQHGFSHYEIQYHSLKMGKSTVRI
jgi:hypothetical protein